jgi:hypothetical protein
MSERPEPRVKTELPVRVWGMGKDGRPFFQNAEARNISSEGAMISGLDQQLTPGDTIGVQYGDKKARFTVIWVIDAGAVHKIQAGVQLLDGQQCPWRHELEPAPSASPGQPVIPSNKRKFIRHKIRVPLELRGERGAHMQTNATDMNGRGCYVETLLPAAVGTPLTVTFWIDSEKTSTSAVVRASDGGVGMGIEFIGLEEESQNRLQRAIEKAAEKSTSGIMGLGPRKS